MLTIAALSALTCFASPAQATTYGASAICKWYTADGVPHVQASVSFGQVTQDAANDDALSKAIEGMNTHARSGKADCQVRDRFSGGQCRYISLSKGSRGVNIGSGPTGLEALGACSVNGRFKCQKPFGGCTN